MGKGAVDPEVNTETSSQYGGFEMITAVLTNSFVLSIRRYGPYQPTFLKNILRPSSGSMNKPSKKPA
jgi:hypothetical protein